MKINEKKLFETIFRYVENLDIELDLLNDKGVFFAPELYVAFGIGKEISKRKKFIFEKPNIQWERERDLNNGGPTDIIFLNSENKDEYIAVIEVKLRDKYQAYEADIKKLLRLEKDCCKKYFCLLLDSFSNENENLKDERLINLETDFEGKIIKIGRKSFQTKQDWYKKQIYCVVNLYEVKNDDNA